MLDKGGFVNPYPSKRSKFLNPNRRDMFSNSILSFDGSLDVESTLLWIDKIDGLFDMEYIPMEGQVKFMTYKLKGRATIRWNQFQNVCMYQGKPPIRTWRWMRRLLQAHCLALGEKEMKNQSRPFMRSHQSNKTTEQH